MYSGSMNKKQGLDLLAEMIHQLSDQPQLVWLLGGDGPTKSALVKATQGLRNVHHLLFNLRIALTIGLMLQIYTFFHRRRKQLIWFYLLRFSGFWQLAVPWWRALWGHRTFRIGQSGGSLCSRSDATAFASALRRLIDSPQLAVEAGLNARVLAEERFGKDAVLGRFERHLRALVVEADTRTGVR